MTLPFSRPTSGPALWVRLAVVLIVFVVGFGCAWKVQGWRMDAVTAEYEKAVAVQEERAKTAEAAAKVAGLAQKSAEEKIKTVYVDRIKEVKVYEKAAAEADRNCTVPVRTVELWGSANAMRPAPTASLADISDSGVKLSDVERQHEREAEICNLWIERAKGLERFYNEQRRALSGE